MCISNNRYPAPRVDFKDTILYGARVKNEAGEIEHICAYYNKVAAQGTAAKNDDFGWETKPSQGNDFGWDIQAQAGKAGNAMLFALPVKKGTTITEKNLIPVAEFPRFMEDYKRAVAPRPPMRRTLSATRGGADNAAKSPIVVKGFDGGVYDVVIAPTAKSIASVIEQVDADKRPTINEMLYTQLDIVYPGFVFVLFCFSEAGAGEAGCAAIRYTPMRDDLIFLPGLDGHNGLIENGYVKLNHTLVVGTFDMKEYVGETVTFSDPPPGPRTTRSIRHPGAMPYWMLGNVIGRILPPDAHAPNGDFLFKVSEVRDGIFRCRRQVPPGWSKLLGKPFTMPDEKPFYITADTIGSSK